MKQKYNHIFLYLIANCLVSHIVLLQFTASFMIEVWLWCWYFGFHTHSHQYVTDDLSINSLLWLFIQDHKNSLSLHHPSIRPSINPSIIHPSIHDSLDLYQKSTLVFVAWCGSLVPAALYRLIKQGPQSWQGACGGGKATGFRMLKHTEEHTLTPWAGHPQLTTTHWGHNATPCPLLIPILRDQHTRLHTHRHKHTFAASMA